MSDTPSLPAKELAVRARKEYGEVNKRNRGAISVLLPLNPLTVMPRYKSEAVAELNTVDKTGRGSLPSAPPSPSTTEKLPLSTVTV
jgi:hypothetical protein